MGKPSNIQNKEKILNDLIGFSGANSTQKSYFPQLQKKLKEIEKEKTKYYNLFNNTSDSIIITDYDGNILEANPETYKRFQYSLNELSKINIKSLLHPNDKSELINFITNQSDNTSIYFDVKQVTKSNQLLYSNINIQKFDYDEQPVNFLVCRDITATKQEENRLRHLHQFYTKVIENSKSIPYRYYFSSDEYDYLGNGFFELFGPCKKIRTRNEIIDQIIEARDFESGKLTDLKKFDEKLINGDISSFSAEFKIKTTDGKIKYLFDSSLPIYDEQTKIPIGTQGIIQDITLRKTNEIELLNAKDYIYNIINSMVSIIIGVDNKCKITHWNEGAKNKFYFEESDVINKPLLDVCPLLKGFENMIFDSLKSKSPLKNIKIVEKNKQTNYYELSVFPLISEESSGAVVRIDNITEKTNMEKVLIQSEKMLSLGGLAAGMAHEINNPIAGMIQNADVLKNRLIKPLPKNITLSKEIGLEFEKLQEYVEKRNITKTLNLIKKAGLQAADIVKNMLSFARKDQSEKSLYDICQIIDTTLEIAKSDYNLKKQSDFKKINIVKNYTIYQSKVHCNNGQIQQVFLNLLKNSAEAMEETKNLRKPEISITIQSDLEYISIKFQDNGPGIKADVIKNIFDPFFTTKSPVHGTGLGLSVSYFIITKNHNGIMTAESLKPFGSKFEIKIPFNDLN